MSMKSNLSRLGTRCRCHYYEGCCSSQSLEPRQTTSEVVDVAAVAAAVVRQSVVVLH